MMNPDPEMRRSSGVEGVSPSVGGSAARRTRIWTRAGLSCSITLFMWLLSRAISAGIWAFGLSVHMGPVGAVDYAAAGTATMRQSERAKSMRTVELGIATPPWVRGRSARESPERLLEV